jgi:hypothetical protein
LWAYAISATASDILAIARDAMDGLCISRVLGVIRCYSNDSSCAALIQVNPHRAPANLPWRVRRGWDTCR